MDQQSQHSEELFNTLSKNKRKKKHRLLRTVLIITGIIILLIVCVATSLRRQVEERFAEAAAEVLRHEVKPGTIYTLVTGSGTLSEVDLESIDVPEGVEVTDVHVEEGDSVREGEVLASVNLSSVMTAMSNLQSKLDELDQQIADAHDEEVDDEITAGVHGRVKIIYAEEGMDVTACMAEYGALAVLSMDNHMAVDIEAGDLTRQSIVRAIRSDGTEVHAIVGSLTRDTATILVPDNGPMFGEIVTILAEDGTELGSGSLYIYMPLAITGYAGTIDSVKIRENQVVSEDTTVFHLENTGFTANYDALIRQRQELEEELRQLLTIYRDGAILSPMDATVSSVSFGGESQSNSAISAGSDLAAMYGLGGQSSVSSGEGILTLYPGLRMEITIGIGETDILALEIGQTADVVVSSISDEVLPATVTGISREASTAMGITQYTAVVTLDRTAGMLPGMTADVDIRIEGADNALIIPLDALHQTSTISYVYTTYDEETMQYGGMVEVTTGMQNHQFVEITSGLSEGDIVCYTEAQEDLLTFLISQFGGRGG